MDATADGLGFSDGYGGEKDLSFSGASNDDSRWGNKMQERANAKNFGRFAEDGATKTGSAAGQNGVGNSPFSRSVDNAREAENNSGFANNVQGRTLEKAAAATLPGGKIALKQAKKLGPVGTIMLIIVALVGIFSGTQSLAGFAWISNSLDQFNALRTSMNKRQTYFQRFKLSSSRNKSITKASIFSPEHFKVSKKMQSKLAKQNINYVEDAGSGTRFLVYEDTNTGRRYAIAANSDDVGKIPSKVKIGSTEVDINTKTTIDNGMIESSSFRKALDVSTRTLKGHIAGWFDDLAEAFHLRIGSSRNKLKNIDESSTDEDIKNAARNTDVGMSEDIKGDAESDAEVEDTRYINEETGEFEKEKIEADDGLDKKNTRNKKISDVKSQAENKINAKVKSVVGAIGSKVNTVCAILRAYQAINMIVSAIQVANVVNYATGFFEAIQKTQAGEGTKEYNFYMNKLSEKGDTYGSSYGSNTEQDITKPIRSGTSSLESVAWNETFSSGAVTIQPDDPVAAKFNRQYAMKQSISNLPIIGASAESDSKLLKIKDDLVGAFDNFNSSVTNYRRCLTAQMGIDLAQGVVELIISFTPARIGLFFKNIGKKLLEVVKHTAIVAAIGIGVSMLIPHIAQWMITDFLENASGEDSAYAYRMAMNIVAGGNMQMSSGLPATKETLTAFWREQQDVIASEGVYERSVRSPFDVTSKYTFFGSIINSLMPIANTWSSPLSTISKTVNTVGSAFMNLRPTANAEGEARFETSINYSCPSFEGENLVGDAFCNSYFVSDMSTISEDPDYVMGKVAMNEDGRYNDNFIWDDEKIREAEINEEGYNPEINPKGELATWVLSCTLRESNFGEIDSNVANAVSNFKFSENNTLDTIIHSGISVIPAFGNIMQFFEGKKEKDNIDWITGKNCYSSEYKYYSRYSEDQRLMENAGMIEQSAVAKFVNDYYEENPLDNSYEGVIARYSGLTKENVEDTLALIDAYEWFAKYDPTDVGPAKPLEKVENYQYESNEMIAKSEEVVIIKNVIFDDLRTKTKIA